MPDRCGDLRIEPLDGSSLILEPLRVEHAVEMAPVLDDPALHTFTGGSPASLEELAGRYARWAIGRSPDGSQQWLNWIVRRRDTGLAVGTVQATVTTAIEDASQCQRVGEVAWVIAREHQHRGHAREAAHAMAGWLRAHGVDVLIAHIHPDHSASAHVARALGLAPTGDVVDGEIRWQS
ncbi:MAG TPA: GNAT family N-acetyltransferase [Microlunatus sp.]|nr:GNAT family N-acetyltransferase [Microlunatus sp.]